MKPIFALTALTGLGALLIAAPVTRPKAEPPGPITPEQLQASENNLKEIVLAWHNYHDTFGNFPSNECDAKGKPLLSWRVQILPFIEQGDVYTQFKLSEPWDSEHNKKLIDKMPKVYAPVRGPASTERTYYQVFTGSHGLIQSGKKIGFANVTDGLSNTLLCVEAAKAVIWTKPDDLEFNGKDLPALGGLFDGKFHGAMGDGSVHRFKKGINGKTLSALITPNGGEIVRVDDVIDTDGEKK